MKRAKRKAESQNNSLTVLLLSLENPSARKAGHGHNGGSVVWMVHPICCTCPLGSRMVAQTTKLGSWVTYDFFYDTVVHAPCFKLSSKVFLKMVFTLKEIRLDREKQSKYHSREYRVNCWNKEC